MDEYRRLQELLRGAGGGRETTLYQGVVKSVEGQTCTVTVAHPGGTFTTVKPMKAANRFAQGDYEDETIKH